MTRYRLAAGLALLAMVAAACGARVPPYLGASGVQPVAAGGGAATGGAGGTGGGTTGAAAAGGSTGAVAGSTGGGSSGSSGSTGSGGGATATGAGGTGGGGSTGTTGGASPAGAGNPALALGPGGFNFDPAAEAAACPSAAGNTASEVGITPDTVNVGNVSGLTGLLPNNFNQAPEAVESLFSAINAHGGICGRKLKLIVEDDGQDSGRNAADHEDLVNKVFAMVGSASLADNGGVQAMVRANIPDIGPGSTTERSSSPVYWTSHGGTQCPAGIKPPCAYDTLMVGLKENGLAPKRFAVVGYNVAQAVTNAEQYAYLFNKYAGSTICYKDESVSPATASYDQDVLQMQQNHCDGVYAVLDVAGNGKLLQAMNRQNYHPPFILSTILSYTDDQIEVAGNAAAQGLQVTLTYVPYFDPQPMMQLYQSQLHTYQPGKRASGFGVLAWSDAQLFVYSLIKAGQNPTRAKLVAAIKAIQKWDTGGMMSPAVPGLQQPANQCMIELVYKGTQWSRLWPSQAFYCKGDIVSTAG
jgi:ABC-type branched-subunit amino acid transport system substrate-binding protein